MCAAATLLLMAALPALAGQGRWCADGEVVALEGAGPAFAPQQHTAVLAPAGHAATLDCRVLRLRDKSVSWVRSRDLQILSHAGTVFTADARVSAAAVGARHSLRIERLRTTDAGRYECQVNTEPKMSLFFNLTVVDEPVPEVVVSVLGAAGVTARAGGAATLACQARYEPPPRQLPLPDLDIRWQKGNLPISLQSGRGVALDTQRWAARVESRLTLAALRADDAGQYSCSAAGRAATLTLDIDRLADDDRAEAMQRDQEAARGRGAPAGGVLAGGVLAGGVLAGGVLAGGVLAGGVLAGGVLAGGVLAGGVLAGGVLAGGVLAGGVLAGGVLAGGILAGGALSAGARCGVLLAILLLLR